MHKIHIKETIFFPHRFSWQFYVLVWHIKLSRKSNNLCKWCIKVIWKANIVEFFFIKYFHLILTKINCITLKICSKADFKSKSQNIWQQIILFSNTVMQMICMWTQDLNSFGEIIAHAQCSVDEKIYIYIPCVPHKNNCKKKLVHTTWNRQIPQ